MVGYGGGGQVDGTVRVGGLVFRKLVATEISITLIYPY